ncbi:hypothetical protein [Streptomyces sp. NPDC088270]
MSLAKPETESGEEFGAATGADGFPDVPEPGSPPAFFSGSKPGVTQVA